MDEPFAALDEITRFRLNDDLLRLWQAHSWTVVFVTHSVYESVYLASRIAVIAARPGRVLAELEIDAPYPRSEAFRTSEPYNACCRAGLGQAARGDGVRPPMPALDAARLERAAGARPGARPELDLEARSAASAAASSGSRGSWPRSRSASLALAVWELIVRLNHIPHYILPGPLLVLQALIEDRGILLPSLLITLQITFMALGVAILGGVGLAILFSLSKWIELASSRSP